MSFSLSGLIAAPFTPFTRQGELAVGQIEPMARLLAESGCTGAFVAGTTGEGLSLSMEERMELAKRWVDVAGGTDFKVIIHVGHNSLPESRALAKQAGELGADAIAGLPPSYFKPGSVEDLITFCAEVAAEAPETPFYLYHIPAMTGVRFPVVEFLQQGSARIPTLRGVKFSDSDFLTLQECLHTDGGRFDLLLGYDEALLAGLALGVRGTVGSTYNFAAPLYRRMWKLFESGNMEGARSEQFRAAEMVRFLMGYGFLPAAKSLMGMLGVDCGPVRAPLPNLTAEQQGEIRARIEKAEVLSAPVAMSSASG